MVNRKGIVVYFKSKKVLRLVEKNGVHITYVNHKGRYLTGYVDTEHFEQAKERIENLRQVRRVEASLLDMSEMSFEE